MCRSCACAYCATRRRSAAVVAAGGISVLGREQLRELRPARQVAVVLVDLGVLAIADVHARAEQRHELSLGEVVRDLVEVLVAEAGASSRLPTRGHARPGFSASARRRVAAR